MPQEKIKEENLEEVKAAPEDNVIANIPASPPPPLPLPKPAPTTEPKPRSKPLQPEFSEELLQAVKNWRAIPPSVFPLSSVTIKASVEFIAKSTSGEIIARAQKQSGDEVVALGVVGNELILSPSKSGKMRGKISINQTDFKQGVAYLFELRKQQRADYENRQKQLAKNNKISGEKHSVSSQRNDRNGKIEEESSLFEDLPIPGDFGHGKFCICTDCREKRLAATGSMK